MSKTIMEGELVRIKLPYNDIRVMPDMRRYDGQEAVVSKKVVHKIPVYDDLGRKQFNTWTYFELDGVVSKYGVPYGFNSDMLVSVES